MHSPLDHSFICDMSARARSDYRRQEKACSAWSCTDSFAAASIFLLQASIFGKYCSVYWEIVLYFVLFSLGFSGFFLNISGAVVQTRALIKLYWKDKSSNGHCRILGKFIVLSGAQAAYLEMCLIIEPDPTEVSFVWSQAKLPDVEVFPFWWVASHLMGQL